MKIRKNWMSVVTILTLTVSFLPRQVKNLVFLLIFIVSFVRIFRYLVHNGFNVFKNRDKTLYEQIILSLFIVAYSIINTVYNGISIESIERLFQLFTAVFLLLSSANYDWDRYDMKLIFLICKFLIIINLLVWCMKGFARGGFAGIYTHSSGLGSAMFFCVVFFIIKENKELVDKIFIILAYLMIIVANSRAVIGAAVCFTIVYFLLSYDSKKFKWIFDGVILISCILPVVYMMIYNSGMRSLVNNYFRKMTSKNFFSGRQLLWGKLIECILKKPWIGYGLNITPEKLIGNIWSSHNWYLQVVLQMGIIGFVLLIMVLRTIWKNLLLLDNNKAIISASYMVGVLIWQSFEVSITQNNFPSGIVVWLIFGIGLNNTYNIKLKNI